MAAQPLRAAATAFRLNRLEHARHVARVVAGPRHDLRAEEICLPLVFAAVLQKDRAGMNWLPSEMAWPATPPMIAPAICPRTEPT